MNDPLNDPLTRTAELNKAKNICRDVRNAMQSLAALAEMIECCPSDTVAEEADQLAAAVKAVAYYSNRLVEVEVALR